MIMTKITCSILEYPYTSDDENMNAGTSKATQFEPKIKHLTKETILGRRS